MVTLNQGKSFQTFESIQFEYKSTSVLSRMPFSPALATILTMYSVVDSE